MCYTNRHFTYLLTYLLLQKHATLQLNQSASQHHCNQPTNQQNRREMNVGQKPWQKSSQGGIHSRLRLLAKLLHAVFKPTPKAQQLMPVKFMHARHNNALSNKRQRRCDAKHMPCARVVCDGAGFQ